jgi:hypothetical protein
MGLEVDELETRAAEIEAQLAGDAPTAPPSVEAEAPSEPDTLQILAPGLHEGDNLPLMLVGGDAAKLPEHRAAVMEVCLAQGVSPITIAQFPADDAEAVQASFTVVDNVRAYIGIFAYRYGRVPRNHVISITEMVYDRVVESGIPRLIFFMGKKHPLDPDDVERGEGAAKLAGFKARLRDENDIYTFNAIDELRTQVAEALQAYHITQPGE